MRKIFFILTTVILVLTTACCDKEEDNVTKMTMTTAKEGLVRIALAGTGTAIINWGDGTPDETVTLTDLTTRYNHTYTSANARTITITGDDVTYLHCGHHVLDTWTIVENQLTALDVSKNPMLTRLYCSYNKLKNLDLSKNPVLTELYCSNNELRHLDLSKNPVLTELTCSYNQLTTLDLSKNPVLTGLTCSYNQLTTLDVSKNPVLTGLSCSYNQLTTLDVSKNPVLTGLAITGNLFEAEKNGEGLNPLFRMLPGTLKSKILRIEDNPGTAACDPSIAEAKGWVVYR